MGCLGRPGSVLRARDTGHRELNLESNAHLRGREVMGGLVSPKQTVCSQGAATSGLSWQSGGLGFPRLTWDFFLWMWMSPPSARVHTAQVTM